MFLWSECIAVVHTVVVVAGSNHDVSASTSVHYGGARMFVDDVLCARWASWAYALDDQDL